MVKGNYVNYSLAVVSVLLLLQRGEATTFTVGGSSGWAVPSNNNPVYNQWAEKLRFQIGDSLLFVYPSENDSVLRVNNDDYDNCNTNSPLEKYTDGHTELNLNQSGPHYFISGNKDNCQKNEKLLVVVLADRTKKASPPTQSSPPSPPPSTTAPAPAPVVADQPPASEPPTDTTAEAPSAESHPPSAAASTVLSFVGSFGAFVGSSLFLGF